MTTSTTIETPAAVETPEAAGADIKIVIDDGPITPDFDGCSRGWRSELILDAEERKIYVYTCIGAGTLGTVWHGIDRSASVNESASGEHVRAILEDNRDLIDSIFDCFEGRTWDGSNHRGTWSEEADGLIASLEAKVAEAPCFWSAGDWFSPAWSECKRDLEKRIGDLGGEALDKKLGEVAEAWVTEGASNDALLDADDVRKQIDQMVEELREGDADLWIVEGGEATALDECEAQAAIDDLPNLGETWWIVEATSEYTARVEARKVRGQGAGAGLATVRALLDSWNYDELERIGEHLPVV